jgi:hypothetical protein
VSGPCWTPRGTASYRRRGRRRNLQVALREDKTYGPRRCSCRRALLPVGAGSPLLVYLTSQSTVNPIVLEQIKKASQQIANLAVRWGSPPSYPTVGLFLPATSAILGLIPWHSPLAVPICCSRQCVVALFRTPVLQCGLHQRIVSARVHTLYRFRHPIAETLTCEAFYQGPVHGRSCMSTSC